VTSIEYSNLTQYSPRIPDYSLLLDQTHFARKSPPTYGRCTRHILQRITYGSEVKHRGERDKRCRQGTAAREPRIRTQQRYGKRRSPRTKRTPPIRYDTCSHWIQYATMHDFKYAKSHNIRY